MAASPSAPAGNIHEFSVGELSAALKRAIEEGFGFVRVRGEISGLKRAASGHMYFSLKDENAVLDSVMWRGTTSRLQFKPEDGLEVVCTGKITTYAGRSKYQIVVEQMEPAGAGALLAQLEKLKKKLAAEGLFSDERKRKIPALPEVIGVVTSPTGAVIRDILHRLADRFPRHVLLWPVLVQGEGAAEQIAGAIRGFNALLPGGPVPVPDVLIVARGGGSIEDLWAFNEEIVVRAAAESRIPLISAVGHETDTTLIDFASDRRAPTPTAAAEIAVPVRAELLAQSADLGGRLGSALLRLAAERRQRLEGLARGLPRPEDVLGAARQRLDDRAERLALAGAARLRTARQDLTAGGAALRPSALRRPAGHARDRLEGLSGRLGTALKRLLSEERIRRTRDGQALAELGERLAAGAHRLRERRAERLAAAASLLRGLSYERTLERGFALVEGPGGTIARRAEGLSTGDGIEIRFADGRVRARVEKAGKPKPPRPGAAAPKGDVQGDLF